MNSTVFDLRKKHPRFVYHSYKHHLEGRNLKLSFHFEIEPDISFFPDLTIEGINAYRFERLEKDVIDNFVFHLGLIEMLSYWKASCSAGIFVKAGFLDDYQKLWWKDLLIKGLGEFFYTNQVDYSSPDFIKITADKIDKEVSFQKKLNPEKYLLPVGGGKDSSITLALLKNTYKEVLPFCLNATNASLQTIEVSGFKNTLKAVRRIDTKLINLNKSGYLNGHTPFSAYLAFLSSFIAILGDVKTILVSNGRSANEGNAYFNDDAINHQYSKSFEFEKKFREYSKKYLAEDLDFISFLRPLYELQIAKLFSKYQEFFSEFKSCNRNQKLNSWCHQCSKCLFVYAILYPFVDFEILTTKIFSRDLFEDEKLMPIVSKFLQFFNDKPFDCVGTREETKLAFYLCLEKAKKSGKKLPMLLQIIDKEKLAKLPVLEKSKKEILEGWDVNNFLTKDLERTLKKSVNL